MSAQITGPRQGVLTRREVNGSGNAPATYVQPCTECGGEAVIETDEQGRTQSPVVHAANCSTGAAAKARRDDLARRLARTRAAVADERARRAVESGAAIPGGNMATPSEGDAWAIVVQGKTKGYGPSRSAARDKANEKGWTPCKVVRIEDAPAPAAPKPTGGSAAVSVDDLEAGHPLTVKCPTCEQPRGERCITRNTGKPQRFHTGRVERAEEKAAA